MADIYSRGEISLREAAKVLDMPLREAMELFWDMGVAGNLDAGDTLKAISVVQRKLSKG